MIQRTAGRRSAAHLPTSVWHGCAVWTSCSPSRGKDVMSLSRINASIRLS